MYSAIIPVYNERDSLEGVLRDLHRVLEALGKPFEIIVVDDGSTDGSGKIAEEAKGVQVLRHLHNKGYGAAIKTGLKQARFDWIVICDADGSYDPAELPKLVKELEGADMVVGARTGPIVHEPLHRALAKWFLRSLASYLAEYPIPDLNSGFRVFRKNLALKYRKILPSGFSLTSTITLAFFTEGLNVKYVPINYQYRVGRSKIRPLKDGFNFVTLILRTITYFKPLKIFLPLAGFLFVSAMFLAYWSIFWYGEFLYRSTLILVVASIQIASLGLIADLIVKKTNFD